MSYEEQIMSADKYPSIFSRQMEAIVYIYKHNINVTDSIGERPKRSKIPYFMYV